MKLVPTLLNRFPGIELFGQSLYESPARTRVGAASLSLPLKKWHGVSSSGSNRVRSRTFAA